MISADLHLHTCYSHGCNTPFEMHAAACARKLKLIGFSEHSPRPVGYDYTNEYREHLTRHFPDYISQVLALKNNSAQNPDSCQVLLGLEMDWLPLEEEFVRKSCSAHDYDYLIGSVHFLGNWGFDDSRGPWENASQEECEQFYMSYFSHWLSMLKSGLFQIAGHPDLIKIYSVEKFHIWLNKEGARKQIHECLLALKESGMAMEVSSAGLRKVCNEIYPCPVIMEMAASLDLPISFASDAHNIGDVGADFASLAKYAASFGYDRHAVFNRGRVTMSSF